VLDEDGTVLGVVHVSRDISAYKTVEAARETALAEAVRLARQRSEFLARMSHELRTPLNSILGYAQILQHRKQLTDAQARGIAIIQSSGEHLLALINDILDLARIDASKLELHPTEIDLGVFLKAVADLIRVKTQEKGLLFRYEAAGLPAVVRVDERRLRQVLLNFLSNAVKFTDSGEICLRVQSLSIPTDSDPGSSTARLRFQVQDSGIGMSEEQMARIFHAFEQVADAERREGGAGLGLAISQQLVHLMGGETRVESRLGQGSLFSFELQVPVPAGQAVISPVRRRIIGYEGPRLSILVVDDVAKNRAMLMDTLTPFGFEVLDACDGREALVQAERGKPDLIIMDVVMPVMDGLETTRQLRRLPNSAEIPVVAVSANATREEAVRSYDAGVDAFLPKPIECDTLLQVIGEQLGLSWIFEDTRAMYSEVEGELVTPPPEEMDVLHRLAQEGNMRNIGRRADYLVTMDVLYAPFAAQLKKLADGYESNAILALVDRYRRAAR
jgi:signal transduction histidine kinase/DNA-binding NarL/FixJ family response regulator